MTKIPSRAETAISLTVIWLVFLPVAAVNAQDGGLGWTFHDVEAETAIRRLEEFGLKLPVEVKGRLTLSVRVDVPWETVFARKKYRLYGQLTSPKMTVAGIEAKNVKAKLSYVDGLLRLDDLNVDVPDLGAGAAAANLSGKAAMQLEPRRDLTASVELQGLSLGGVAAALEATKGLAVAPDCLVSGSVSATVAVDRLRDLSAWSGTGRLHAERLQAQGLPPADVKGEFHLKEGVLTAPQLTVDAEYIRLEGSARFDTTASMAYSAKLKLTTRDLSQFNQLKNEWRLPFEIDGRLGASLRVEGALSPRRLEFGGAVTVRDLRLAQLAIDRVDFRYQGDTDEVRLQSLRATLAGGTLKGSAVATLDPAELRVGLRIDDFMLEQFSRLWPGLPDGLHGRAGGTLQARLPMARLGEPAAWYAVGKLDLRDLALAEGAGGGAPAASVQSDVKLDKGTLRLSKFSATLRAGTLAGSIDLGVVSPYQTRLDLSATNVDLSLFNTFPPALRPPLELAGQSGFSARLEGTLEPLALEGEGSLSARNLRAGRLRIDSWSGKFSTDGRRIDVKQWDASLYGGAARGSLVWPLRNDAPAEAAVRWRQVQLGSLLADLDIVTGNTAGAASGKLKIASKQEEDPREFASWRGNVELDVNDLRLFGWLLRRATLRAVLDQGWLDLSDASIETIPSRRRPATKLSASGRLKVSEPFDFKARFDLAEFNLAALRSLPATIRPPWDLAGSIAASAEAEGTLLPLKFLARGSASAKQIELDRARIESASLILDADETTLKLSKITASMYEGKLEGEIYVPLAPDSAGSLKLAMRRIDVGNLLADVGRLPFELSGRLDGDMDARIPAGEMADREAWQLHVSLDASTVDVNTLSVGDAHARLDYESGTVRYDVNGEILDGNWQVAGVFRPADLAAEKFNHGHLEVAKAKLDRLGRILRQGGALDSLAGMFDVHLDYRHSAEMPWLLGQGRVELTALEVNDVQSSERLTGLVKLTASELRLEQLKGSLAGGSLDGGGSLSFGPTPSSLRIALRSVQLKRLLVLWPSAAKNVKGTADLELRAFASQVSVWRFDGNAVVREAELHGVPVSSARLPLRGTLAPAARRAEVQVRDASAEVASGHVTGTAAITLASAVQFDGRARFTDIHLHRLVHASSAARRLGSGKISGSLTLAGHDVSSLRGLTGTLDAKLRDAHAAGAPVFNSMQSYLPGSAHFASGNLRARLANGVVRIERLSLNSPNLQVYVDGTVLLAGRLKLGVVVNTGKIQTNPSILLLASRLAIFAAPPAALLLQANQFLANQVIYLDVRGTIRSPSVRVRALPQLEEEVIRFFLLQSPVPASMGGA